MTTKHRREVPDLEDREMVFCYCGRMQGEHGNSKKDLVNCPRFQQRYTLTISNEVSSAGKFFVRLFARDSGELPNIRVSVYEPGPIAAFFGQTFRTRLLSQLVRIKNKIQFQLAWERDRRNLAEEARQEFVKTTNGT